MTTVSKIREWIDLCRDGDEHAIENLEQADMDLLDALLDVAEAAQSLNLKNSPLADALEELELVEWVIIPPKKNRST